MTYTPCPNKSCFFVLFLPYSFILLLCVLFFITTACASAFGKQTCSKGIWFCHLTLATINIFWLVLQGGHKVGEKISEFSRLFQSHKLTFPQVIGIENKCDNDLHQGSFHIHSSNITSHYCTSHKYLNDELKILCLLQFFPEVAQNSLSFPCSEKSLSIPGFPGLWPPSFSILEITKTMLVLMFDKLRAMPTYLK